jgi:hypothetical protein
MNSSVKTLVAGAMAAVIVAFAAVAPASANPWWPHPYHYGHYGYGWGPAAAVGIFGLAAGAAIASQDGCVRYQPMYDRWGNYIGQRPVNVCY